MSNVLEWFFLNQKLAFQLCFCLWLLFRKVKYFQVALWRYNRGNRVLSFNQSTGDCNADVVTGELDADEDYDIPQKEVSDNFFCLVHCFCLSAVAYGEEFSKKMFVRLENGIIEDGFFHLKVCC